MPWCKQNAITTCLRWPVVADHQTELVGTDKPSSESLALRFARGWVGYHWHAHDGHDRLVGYCCSAGSFETAVGACYHARHDRDCMSERRQRNWYSGAAADFHEKRLGLERVLVVAVATVAAADLG